MKIEYSKFMFELEASERLRVSPFFENTLRGLIGAQIHKLSCGKTLEKCDSCSDRHSCLYSYLYNTPAKINSENLSKYNALPHPYIFFFPRNRLIFEKGDKIIFYLTLFGKALNYLSYYVHAVSNACKIGIGRTRVPLVLNNVEAVYSEGFSEKIYSAEEPFLNSFKRQSLDIESSITNILLDDCEIINSGEKSDAGTVLCNIKLSFDTAFRVKENEKLISEIEFSTIIKSLLRRFSNIAYFHCGNETDIDFKKIIEKAKKVNILKKDINWFEYDRYSSRQNAKMKLGGIIGEMTFKAAGAWAELLKIGKIIHIGKNTSFGFGKYDIEVVSDVK